MVVGDSVPKPLRFVALSQSHEGKNRAATGPSPARGSPSHRPTPKRRTPACHGRPPLYPAAGGKRKISGGRGQCPRSSAAAPSRSMQEPGSRILHPWSAPKYTKTGGATLLRPQAARGGSRISRWKGRRDRCAQHTLQAAWIPACVGMTRTFSPCNGLFHKDLWPLCVAGEYRALRGISLDGESWYL